MDFVTILPLVLVGSIGLIMGGLAGALAAGGFGSKSTQSERKPGKKYTRLFSLWRDRESGKFLLDIDESYYSSAEQLTSKRLNGMQKVIEDLRIWLGVSDPSSLYFADQRPAAIKEQPAMVAETGNKDGDSFASRLATLFVNQTDDSPEVKPAEIDLSEMIREVINPASKEAATAPAAPKSIAAQIDEILQEKLSGSELKSRSIHLSDDPTLGLVIEIDGRNYAGIDQIPDPEIKSFIQQSVSDWEKNI